MIGDTKGKLKVVKLRQPNRGKCRTCGINDLPLIELGKKRKLICKPCSIRSHAIATHKRKANGFMRKSKII